MVNALVALAQSPSVRALDLETRRELIRAAPDMTELIEAIDLVVGGRAGASSLARELEKREESLEKHRDADFDPVQDT
jgi:hypothetical protein